MLLNARQVVGPPPVREKLILLAIEDITLRKDLAQQRDNALKAREELIAVVSHELKNPLTAITSSLDLVKRVLSPDKGQEQLRKLLDNIYVAARRMTRITSDLLDVSKIESGHFPLELTTVQATSLIEEVIALSLPLALDKAIRIEKNIGEEVDDISCDRDRVSQALLNLLNNAIKFTGEGGVITVDVYRVNDQIRFQVKDTGCGIPTAQLPHVFERFWQAKHKQYLGSGLGLYITKSIVETHGGKVGVESRDGEGSTFYFTLPVGNRATTTLPATKAA
jgi:signal transduction histidine kinase